MLLFESLVDAPRQRCLTSAPIVIFIALLSCCCSLSSSSHRTHVSNSQQLFAAFAPASISIQIASLLPRIVTRHVRVHAHFTFSELHSLLAFQSVTQSAKDIAVDILLHQLLSDHNLTWPKSGLSHLQCTSPCSTISRTT